MAAPKLKIFLFVDAVGTNAWLNEVAKKTGFEAEEEIDSGWAVYIMKVVLVIFVLL